MCDGIGVSPTVSCGDVGTAAVPSGGPEGPGWTHAVPGGPRWSQVVPSGPEWSRRPRPPPLAIPAMTKFRRWRLRQGRCHHVVIAEFRRVIDLESSPALDWAVLRSRRP